MARSIRTSSAGPERRLAQRHVRRSRRRRARGGSEGADRAEPGREPAGDHERRNQIRLPAPPWRPLLERGALKASDFRRALEQSFRAGADVGDVPLVGIAACTRPRQSCDLSRGVQTDDETGTIVFRLRRPVRVSEFLSDDVRFLFPIPDGTPNRDLGTPVPSTGPYMIESYVPGRALTLVRNPYFRVRSKLPARTGSRTRSSSDSTVLAVA